MNKKTLVLGASLKPERYSNKAVRNLRAKGNDVIAMGLRSGEIEDVKIITDRPEVDNLDTVSLYLNAENQQSYYDYIIGLSPKRVIFNPGAENPEFEKLLEEHKIIPLEACTLVLLATGQY